MITNVKDYFKILEEMQKDDTVLPIVYQENEPMLEVDLNFRMINVPAPFNEYIAVQGDHNAETVYFRMDRYFDAIDLYDCTCIIQYQNADKEFGVYLIKEKDIRTFSEEGKIILGWKLDKGFTKSAGAVMYSLRIYKLNDENEFIYDLNTIPAIGTIAVGMDALDKMSASVDPTAALLTELINRIDKLSTENNSISHSKLASIGTLDTTKEYYDDNGGEVQTHTVNNIVEVLDAHNRLLGMLVEKMNNMSSGGIDDNTLAKLSTIGEFDTFTPYCAGISYGQGYVEMAEWSANNIVEVLERFNSIIYGYFCELRDAGIIKPGDKIYENG